jgi:hypothetical protein
MKIFKRCFLILIIFLMGPGVSGQPYLGIFGGISSSKLTGDSPEKASYKGLLSLSFGANLDLKLARQVYISLQPSFTQEGTKVFYDVPLEYEPVDSIRIRLNYVSFPVLLKAASNNRRFYAIAGVEASYLVSGNLKTGDQKEDVAGHVTGYNLAAVFGAGMRIPLGLPRLVIELRYSQGLVNLTDEFYQRSYIPRVKTTGFRMNVGLEIPLSENKN